MRRFAIGDIHGCAKALRTVVQAIDPAPADELVFLGDYIDRGSDSRDTVSQIIELQSHCRVVAIQGNHELMMLAIINRGFDDAVWLASGGRATVTSYGGSVSKIPDTHLQFFHTLRPYYETAREIFVHAGYHPMLEMHQQDDATLFWNHLPGLLPRPHVSGKRVYVGHTPQPSGDVLDIGHLVCLDTYCFGGGYLSALNLDTGQVIQADVHGHLRRDRTAALVALYQRCRKLLRTRRRVREFDTSREQTAAEKSPRHPA